MKGCWYKFTKPPKAAWEMVYVPKKWGRFRGNQHEEAQWSPSNDKPWYFNNKDIPWVSLIWEKHYSNGKLSNNTRKGSFWWRDILKLLEVFKSFSIVQVQNGNAHVCFGKIIGFNNHWKKIFLGSTLLPKTRAYQSVTYMHNNNWQIFLVSLYLQKCSASDH